MIRSAQDDQRIVITGVGLTAPNGDGLADYRAALLAGKSGVTPYHIRYVGDTLAGECHFDEQKYQKRKERRRGTRAGSIAIFCAISTGAIMGVLVPLLIHRIGLDPAISSSPFIQTANDLTGAGIMFFVARAMGLMG